MLLRGVLLEKIIDVAYVRSNCWPAPLRHAVDVLSAHDAKLGARVAKALDDDAELLVLARDLTSPRIAVRAAETRPEEPVNRAGELWALAPPALARLPIETASMIHVEDLRRMSKLQMLTVRRVHGARMGVHEQNFIESALAG